MKQRLSAFPADYAPTDADADGICGEAHGIMSEKSIQILDDFLVTTAQGKSAKIITLRYTTEGDPLFYYVVFDGVEYFYVADFSRDKFGGGEDSGRFAYLKVFDDPTGSTEGQQVRSVLLTNHEYQTYNSLIESDASDRIITQYRLP